MSGSGAIHRKANETDSPHGALGETPPGKQTT